MLTRCGVLLLCLLGAWGTVCAQSGMVINGSRTIYGHLNYGEDAGSTDAYVVALTPPIPNYVVGTRYTFKANTANTGACSLNIDGRGVTALKSRAGSVKVDPANNTICAGQIVDVIFDGTDFQLLSQPCTASGGGAGDALVANPLSQFAATTSAQLAGVLTDERGTVGGFARIDGTLVIATGKTVTQNNTVTWAGTDGASIAFGGGGTIVYPSGTPTAGQLALWTTASVIQGLTALPAANFPALTGDVTTSAASLNTTLVNVPSGTPHTGSALFSVIGAPATPAAGKGSVYVDNASKNLAVKDDAGVVKHGVQSIACSGQFLSAINDAGLPTCSSAAGSGNVSNVGTPTNTQLAVWTGATTIQGVTTLPTGTMPALIGDITNTVGTLSTTITAGVVTLAKMANLAPNTLIGRTTAGTGVPEALTVLPAALEPAHTGDVTNSAGNLTLTLVNVPSGAPHAGSALYTAITAPSTPAAGKGSVYVDSTSKNLAVKDDAGVIKHAVQTITCSGQFISAINDAGLPTCSAAAGGGNVSNTGTPTAGQLALWTAATVVQGLTALPAANFPALTGDVTTSAASLNTTIAANAVTLAKMANMATTSLLGRSTAGTGSPEVLSVATASTLLGVTGAKLGYIQLPVGAAKLPATDAALPDQSENHTRLLFDAATSWCASWQFVMPPDYGTGLTARALYSMTSASGAVGVSLDIAVMAITPGDAVDLTAKSYAAVNNCDDATVPGTPGFLDTIVCPLTTADSAAAGDLMKVKVCRAVADSADTATGNLELVGLLLEYVKN